MIHCQAKRQRHPCRRQAFTLVEVMATLVLLAIVLPVAMEGVSLATRTVGNARDQIEAASLAETKLGEIVAAEAWRNGNLSGDFGEEWPQYGWSSEVSDWDGTILRLLTVRVGWTRSGKERSVALGMLVYAGEE